MAIKIVYGKLDPETLGRVRQIEARLRAIESHQGAFNRFEIEEAYQRWFQFYGELATQYHIPDDEEWNIDLQRGIVRSED